MLVYKPAQASLDLCEQEKGLRQSGELKAEIGSGDDSADLTVSCLDKDETRIDNHRNPGKKIVVKPDHLGNEHGVTKSCIWFPDLGLGNRLPADRATKVTRAGLYSQLRVVLAHHQGLSALEGIIEMHGFDTGVG